MPAERPKLYLSDGEGPILLKDLARDIALKKLRPNAFDIISMWVAHESQYIDSKFKPGDTLGIIIPHLLLHHVDDQELKKEAAETKSIHGARVLIDTLKESNWNVRIISTAYNALWDENDFKLGLTSEEIACTKLNLESLYNNFTETIAQEVHLAQEDIFFDYANSVANACERFRQGTKLDDIFYDEDITQISEGLSNLHLQRLPKLGFDSLKLNPILNARRKVESLDKYAKELGLDRSEIIFVGDSITDSLALQAVNEAGGLAIAFNADEFAIRNSTIAIASLDAMAVAPIAEIWEAKGRQGVKNHVETLKATLGAEQVINTAAADTSYDWVSGKNIEAICQTHKLARIKARGGSEPLL